MESRSWLGGDNGSYIVFGSASRMDLVADDNALAAGCLLLLLVVGLVLGGAVLGIAVAAAGAAAVEPDAIALAGDAVAFAGAAGAGGADAGWGAGVGAAAGGQGWDIGVVVGLEFGVVLLLVEVGLSEARGEGLKGRLVVLGVDHLAGLVWALGTWGSDARGRERAALRDSGARDAARRTRAGGGGGGRLGNVEDVEVAAGGGLGGEFAGGVMADVVAVDDVVVPVSLTLLESGALELELTDPAAGLLGVLGKRKLTLIVVPGAEKMDGLAAGGGAEREVELDSGHCEVVV